MNTGVGNCLLVCSLLYDYFAPLPIEYEIVNNGDDFGIIMERASLPRLAGLVQWFLQHGMILELEDPVYIFEQIEFCQTHPVWDGCAYRMCRDPRMVLSKDMATLKYFRDTKGWDRYRGAVADCGKALATGIPVLQAFYDRLGRGCRVSPANDPDLLESGFAVLSRGLARVVRPVSEESRLSFYLAFGYSPDEQRELEVLYESSLEYGFDAHVEPSRWHIPEAMV
jgi:hypothetical protein